MNKPQNPVVLLTGASSGIGLSLARKLWKSSFRVAITLRESSFHKIKDEVFKETDRFLILPLDINYGTERRNVIDQISERWGGVDILINNAGISYRSVIEHMTNDEEYMQLKTNFLSPMALTRLVLPRMRKQRWGRIINVSSVGGMMAMPTMGSYSASKFALEGASESLWYELKPWDVHVTLVQPGFVRSESFRNVYWSKKSRQSAQSNDSYSVYYKKMTNFIEELMCRSLSTPDSIADNILMLMKMNQPPLRTPVTLDAHFFSFLRRILPRGIYHRILYRNLPGIDKWGKNEDKIR